MTPAINIDNKVPQYTEAEICKNAILRHLSAFEPEAQKAILVEVMNELFKKLRHGLK